MKLHIQAKSEEFIPKKAHKNDAGFDLVAAESALLWEDKPILVDCGFKMALPPGYEAQIRPRSGLASKKCVTIPNSPGTIDAGYRGPVKVVLVCYDGYHKVNKGDRIAQMVVQKLPEVEVSLVSDVNEIESERGEGGFGSTGE